MPTIDTDVEMSHVPYRPLPELTALTEDFWRSGVDGSLRFLRCMSCGYRTHPPGPRCAQCLSDELAYMPVSGLGTVYAFTVNHHPWYPGWTTPYVVAIVQLDEQEDLQLLTNIVNCAPESLSIGDRVRVVFEIREDVALPLFELIPGEDRRVSHPLEGVHILDVSEFGFVPSVAAVLADWGADVVKVEKPSGDPLRGHSMVPGTDDFHVLIEHFNRNKRGIVLDLSRPAGRDALDRLLDWADVLNTNFLPRTLAKLHLTPEQVHEKHPRIIFVRGTGQGSRGPDIDTPGFDGSSWWARGGIGHALSGPDSFARMRAALGDGPTGAMLAGGVAAALYERERTGRGTTVETSLLQGAMWSLAPDLTSTAVCGQEPMMDLSGTAIGPLVGIYATDDGRWLQLTMPEARWWEATCRALGLDELLDDPRYEEANRAEHAHFLRDRFAEAIRSRPLAEVETRLSEQGCVFAVRNVHRRAR